jgi:DNA topoisomerase-1
MADDLARRARRNGLHYVEADALTITRQKTRRGFRYVDGKGQTIRNPKVVDRIRALVIPPAWVEVAIADDPLAHIQAIGRDSEGRLQYRYHDQWTVVRDKVKAERLLRFGRALPKIRARLEADLKRRHRDRRYAAAAAARLIDRALLRSGHYEASIDAGGRGATTLLKRDVQLNGTKISLKFTGKGGKLVEKTIRDPLLLSRLRRLKQLGKKRLFVFKDESGRRCHLSARDLNLYLREAAGEAVTAKDFRTFAASAGALAALCEAGCPDTEAERKRLIVAIMKKTSERLANTPAVARSSYVHPLVVQAFEAADLDTSLPRKTPRNGLSKAETALMRLLEEALA